MQKAYQDALEALEEMICL